jgi:hypothetical protein
MREGTVPVPAYRPLAQVAMIPYYLFRWYRIFGGAEAEGGETPVSVQVFFEHFSRAKNHPFNNGRDSTGPPLLPQFLKL